jgi:hypothetical protein
MLDHRRDGEIFFESICNLIRQNQLVRKPAPLNAILNNKQAVLAKNHCGTRVSSTNGGLTGPKMLHTLRVPHR